MASQRIPNILPKPKVHYRLHKTPTTCSYTETDQPSHISLRHTLILSFCVRQNFPRDLFPSLFPTKPLMHLSSLPLLKYIPVPKQGPGLAESLFVKYIMQNWGKSAGLMLFNVVYTERICVSVVLISHYNGRTVCTFSKC